jgi:hypothetical protein
VRTGRTGGAAQGADPVPWRVKSPAGWRPGATTAAPVRATVLAAPAGAAGRPSLRADGQRSGPLWPAPSTRGAPVAIGERFGQAIVRHEALGHGRDQLAARRVEEADGPPRLTVEATWGPDVGSVRIEFHLRPCIDAKRSNRAGKSLASGGRRRSALQEARGWTRPELLVWLRAPRRNRTGDPILTIDALAVHTASQPLMSLHIRTGEKRCRKLHCGAERGRVCVVSGRFLARPTAVACHDASGHDQARH